MIADIQKNKIFFSEILSTSSKYQKNYKEIIQVLDNLQLDYTFLKSTKDIWTRDYMPIQVNKNKFIEYRYDPDYLQAKKYRNIKSYSDIVCFENNIQTIKTDLIIDGGNVIQSEHSVIMTDKVISENLENYKSDVIIGKLKDLFETDNLALIPWDKKYDYLGHADGMVRFIDNENVIVQDHFNEYDAGFKAIFFGALDKIGVKWTSIQFEIEQTNEDLNWAYLNFLQTKDVILVPQLNIAEDIIAIEILKKIFHQYQPEKIIGVPMNEVVAEGGALNCISWTILK